MQVRVENPRLSSPEGSGEVISMGANIYCGTKALMNDTEFKSTGNQLHVYDFLNYESHEIKYIDNTITAIGNGADLKWQFPDATEYEWTRSGSHKFFGWLVYDNDSNLTPASIFGSEPEMSSAKALTLPASGTLTTDLSTPQFDFLYSNIINRTMDGGTTSHLPVNLTMAHLFSAISIGAENKIKNDIVINSVTIQGLYNTQSAIIDFNEGETEITYTKGSTRGKITASPGITLTTDESVANILTANTSQTTPFLIWPQNATDLIPNAAYGINSNGECETGGDNNPLIIVEYTQGTGAYAVRSEIPLPIPQGDWLPGVHNHIDITFADKIISLKVSVLPWSYTETDVDFKQGTLSIHEGNELSVQDDNCSKDSENKRIFFTSTQPITCNFWLDTPQGGTWIVSKLGDIDAFEIIDGSGTINGEQAEFKIRPLVYGDIDRDYVLKLHFSVRLPDGRTVDADNPVLGTNNEFDYSFIIQKQ